MKKIKIKPSELMFFMGLFLLECASFFVNVTFLGTHIKSIKYLSFAMLIISGILINLKNKKLTYKKIGLILVIFVISIISYTKTQSTMFLELLLIFFNATGFEFDKLIKYDLEIKIFIVIFLVFCNSLGLADSKFVVTRNGETIRNAYGFYHPNTFGMIIMMIFFEFMYLNRENIGKKHYIIALIVLYLIKYTSDTRTAIYSIILYMLLLFIKDYTIWNNRIIDFIKNNLFIILLCISLITTYVYMKHYSFADELNILLSNRLELQAYYMDLFDVNLLGNKIEFEKTLDNGFMKLILNQGLIVIAFLTIIYNFNFKRCKKFNEKELSIIFIIILIFSISESTMFYVYNNIFVCYLLTKNKGDDIINESQNINNNSSP